MQGGVRGAVTAVRAVAALAPDARRGFASATRAVGAGGVGLGPARQLCTASAAASCSVYRDASSTASTSAGSTSAPFGGTAAWSAGGGVARLRAYHVEYASRVDEGRDGHGREGAWEGGGGGSSGHGDGAMPPWRDRDDNGDGDVDTRGARLQRRVRAFHMSAAAASVPHLTRRPDGRDRTVRGIHTTSAAADGAGEAPRNKEAAGHVAGAGRASPPPPSSLACSLVPFSAQPGCRFVVHEGVRRHQCTRTHQGLHSFTLELNLSNSRTHS